MTLHITTHHYQLYQRRSTQQENHHSQEGSLTNSAALVSSGVPGTTNGSSSSGIYSAMRRFVFASSTATADSTSPSCHAIWKQEGHQNYVIFTKRDVEFVGETSSQKSTLLGPTQSNLSQILSFIARSEKGRKLLTPTVQFEPNSTTNDMAIFSTKYIYHFEPPNTIALFNSDNTVYSNFRFTVTIQPGRIKSPRIIDAKRNSSDSSHQSTLSPYIFDQELILKHAKSSTVFRIGLLKLSIDESSDSMSLCWFYGMSEPKDSIGLYCGWHTSEPVALFDVASADRCGEFSISLSRIAHRPGPLFCKYMDQENQILGVSNTIWNGPRFQLSAKYSIQSSKLFLTVIQRESTWNNQSFQWKQPWIGVYSDSSASNKKFIQYQRLNPQSIITDRVETFEILIKDGSTLFGSKNGEIRYETDFVVRLFLENGYSDICETNIIVEDRENMLTTTNSSLLDAHARNKLVLRSLFGRVSQNISMTDQAKWKDKYEEIENKFSSMQRENKRLNEEIEEWKEKYEKANLQTEKLDEERKTQIQYQSHLQHEYANSQKEISRLQNELHELSQELNDQNMAIEAMKLKFESLSVQKKRQELDESTPYFVPTMAALESQYPTVVDSPASPSPAVGGQHVEIGSKTPHIDSQQLVGGDELLNPGIDEEDMLANPSSSDQFSTISDISRLSMVGTMSKKKKLKKYMLKKIKSFSKKKNRNKPV